MRALRPLLDTARDLAGLAALYRHRTPRRGALQTMTTALTLAAALDVVAYSGAITSDWPFITEVVAVTIALLASAVHGRHLLRAHTRPRWVGWVLVAAVPAALLTLVVAQYLPHAAVLPLSLALAAISIGQLRPRTQVATPAARTTS